MGTKPRQSAQLQKRKNARIVSFDDAKRTSARKSAENAVTQAVTKPLSSQSGPTSKKPAARRAAKPSNASKQISAKGVKRTQSRKQSRKEIKIARGAERDGALSMRTEEEIEAEARAQEESRKQDKRSKSRVRAFSKKMRSSIDEKKKARNKAKAEKKFNAAYGDSGPSGSGSQPQGAQGEGGPRAAVYEGKMGASHKKSAKLQAKAAGDAIKNVASGVSIPKANLSKMPSGLVRALAGVAVFALVAVTLYGPAQQYYQQMRETDRLQAEYAAVAARSNTLQSTIDSLRSEEGVEDKAHTDLGYVKKGEQTATVKGANIVDNTEFSSNVAPGSIPAPETWYSPVLDVLFGYSG